MTVPPRRTLTSRDKFPCYKDGASCKKRHPGCHDTCPDYAKAKAENDARKGIERQARAMAGEVNQFKKERAAKCAHTKIAER